jgi:CHRD domain
VSRHIVLSEEGIVNGKILKALLCGVVAALALTAFAVASPSKEAPGKLSAALNVGQEKPIPKGTKLGASGRFTATLTGTSLSWKLTFTHLSGSATAAHIHLGARGVAGAVLVPICGPCTSGATGTAMLTPDHIDSIKAGKTYVNVHTAKNPNGEVRGQITNLHQ